MGFQIYDTSPFSARDSTGLPRSGAKLWFTQTGTNTPVTVYANKAGSSTLTNPVEADADGKWPGIWLSDANATRVRYGLSTASTPTGPWIDDKDGILVVGSTSLGTDGSGWTGDATAAATFRTAIGAQTTMVFETRADASAYAIASTETTIIVTRHTANLPACPGYYIEVADTGTLFAWQFRSNSNTRRWQLDPNQRVSVLHFGGGGGSDDTAAMQAICDYAAAEVLAECVLVEGDMFVATAGATDTAVTLDMAFANMGTANFVFNGTLTATTAMYHMLEIKEVVAGTFRGRLRMRGVETAEPYSLRIVMNGLYLNGVTGCTFDGFYVENFYAEGIRCERVVNNNVTSLGTIYSKRCGSGYIAGGTNTCLTASYSARVDSGSASNADQVTTMTVTAVPNAYIDETIRPVGVFISGEYYTVRAINSATEIEVFPWVDSGAAATGTLYYVYGWVVELMGSDSNVIGAELVSSLRACGALSISCLYGGDFGRVLSEAGAVGMVLGQSPESQVFGGWISQVYPEGNTVDVLTLGGTSYGNTIGSTSATDADYAKIKIGFAPRDGSNEFLKYGVTGLNILSQNGLYFREKLPSSTTNNSITLDLNQPNKIISVYRDNGINDFAVALTAVSANATRLWGYDGGIHFCVLGSGNSGAPAFNVVFTPPGSTTINGTAGAATFRGFSGPPIFAISFDATGVGNFVIKPIAGRDPEGKLDDTSMVDADKTVTPWTDGNFVICATALTAGRTLTLSTTGATAGTTWHLVRTAASTGAFNITFAGKAIATGQWGEAKYDGSAYQLTKFGSL